MKRIALLLILFPVLAVGQAVRVDVPLQTYGPNVPISGGSLPQALWTSYPLIYVCAHPSASLAACQASLITTYTDSTGTTACIPSTSQIVNLPGTSCSPNGGPAGNLGIWYAGGTVDYWVATSYGSYGPFTINASQAASFVTVLPSGACSQIGAERIYTTPSPYQIFICNGTWQLTGGSGGGLPTGATNSLPVYVNAGTTVTPVPLDTSIFNNGYSVSAENAFQSLAGVTAWGDSNTQCFGCPGGITQGWPQLMANDIGSGLLTNYGQLADAAANFSTKAFIYSAPAAVTATGNALNVVDIGTNNARLLVNTAPVTTEYYQDLYGGATWIATSASNRFAATDATKWTPSGVWTLLQTMIRSDVSLTALGTGYSTGDTITVTCTGGTGPTYTATVSGGGPGPVASATLSSYGNNGCNSATQLGLYTSYPTTTSGAGTGAALGMVIGVNQPYVATTAAATLKSIQINVPASGVAYLQYAQWVGASGTAQVTLDSNVTPLVDAVTGSSTLLGQFDATNTANCANLLGVASSTSCAASVSAGSPIAVGARFTGIAQGYHTFTVTTLTNGNFGVLGMSVPPMTHFRGASAPNLFITGVKPEGGNLNPTYFAYFANLNSQVSQTLTQDGLFTPFISEGSLDTTQDFLEAQAYNLINCTANGSLATVTTSIAMAPNPVFPGWTGTISGFAGGCAALNGAVTIPANAAITLTSFQFTTAQTISFTSDSGVWTPANSTSYNGAIGTVSPPLHMSSGVNGGHQHLAGIIEAAVKATGISNGTLTVGGLVNVNPTTAGLTQMGSTGLNANVSGQRSNTAMNPILTPYCWFATGYCGGTSFQPQAGLSNLWGNPTLSVAYTYADQYPSGMAWMWAHYTPSANSLPTAESSFTPDMFVSANRVTISGTGAAGAGSNPLSGRLCFGSQEWNGSAGVNEWACAYKYASAGGQAASPILRFVVEEQAPALTGDQLLQLTNNSIGGFSFDVGVTGTTTLVTMSKPTLTATVQAPAQATVGYPLVAALTTTAATSDNLTVTGMTASGHCELTATNASAALNVATTYVSSKTTNQITVTHTATGSMTYDAICTAY